MRGERHDQENEHEDAGTQPSVSKHIDSKSGMLPGKLSESLMYSIPVIDCLCAHSRTLASRGGLACLCSIALPRPQEQHTLLQAGHALQ